MLYTLLWVVLILAVFAPLSVRQYRLATPDVIRPGRPGTHLV